MYMINNPISFPRPQVLCVHILRIIYALSDKELYNLVAYKMKKRFLVDLLV